MRTYLEDHASVDDPSDARHDTSALLQRVSKASRVRDIATDGLDIHSMADVVHLSVELVHLFLVVGTSGDHDQVLRAMVR